MERPILFSGPMVRAILDGRKTQTRRVLKPQPEWSEGGVIRDAAGGQMDYIEPHWSVQPKPAYAVGTELWVRETWLHIDDEGDKFDGMGTQTYYAADQKEKDMEWTRTKGLRWKPSIHMPRWASRITLRVTAVKVERLQDISEEDALAEGVGIMDPHHPPPPIRATYAEMYRDLWDSINGPGSWDANPWVVAYTFERVLPK